MAIPGPPYPTRAYRPDIDGLRALAIIAVIVFHSGLNILPGGFVGVDVFFVISGYLITDHILGDLRRGEFSLLGFYERRIRRVFPALAAVLAVTGVLGALLLLPVEFAAFGKSLAAAALSGSNILFWRESDYFHIDSQLKPLLHTWSLAVEEQFYLLFPFGMIIIQRFLGKKFAVLLPVAWVLSLALMLLAIMKGQTIAGFYLLPTRAWELLTGSCLTLRARRPNNKVMLNGLALTSLSVVIGSCFLLNSNLPYLGMWLLVPVLAAAAFIYTGDDNKKVLANRWLGNRALVFIGLISYSLYLWHWPVLVFTRYYLIREPGTAALIGMLAATTILSVLSWKFIEQPFRRKNHVYSRRQVFAWFFVINLAFLIAGLAIYKTSGAPQRFNAHILALAQVEKGIPGNYEPFYGGERIVFGDTGAPAPKILLWGDSHANSVSPAMDKVAKAHHVSVLMLKEAGCMPSADMTIPQPLFCKNIEPAIVAALNAHPEIKTVVLAGRWSAYPRWWSHNMFDAGTSETRQEFATALTRTVEMLTAQKRRVVIVAEPPSASYPVPSVLARMALYKYSFDIRPTRADYLMQQDFNLQLFAQLHKKYGAVILYPHEKFCGPVYCTVAENGQSFYYDGNHLSTVGANYIAGLFEPIFSGMKR